MCSVRVRSEFVSNSNELKYACMGFKLYIFLFIGTNRSKILLKASVFTISLNKCNATLVDFNQLSNQPSLRGLSESQMCALNRITKSDACQGDSGGPIFIREQTGMSTIHGIVSFGVSCGTDLPG